MKKLKKSKTDEVFDGVLGGIAEHLEIDSALIRIVYCLLTAFAGWFPGVVIYIILMVCIPDKEDV